MPVHYQDALKQTRMNAVTAAVDSHATIDGYIEIGDGTPSPWAFGNRLVKINLEDPSFAAATTAGVINMNITGPATSLDGVATADGTARVARICDGADVVRISGLVVGTAIAANVEVALSATAVSTGQTVSLTAGTITHAS